MSNVLLILNAIRAVYGLFSISKADPEGLGKKTFKVKTQIEGKFAFFRIRELKSCNTMEIFWVF
jgi:hypothetical protein